MAVPEVIEPLEPLWHATAPAVPDGAWSRTQPVDAMEVDAVVVGAGVTGASAALHFAECGARVAVFERGEPGSGTSGCADGQVIAGYHQTPDALVAAYGAQRGEQMIEFGGGAPQLVFDLIARHAIDCDAERAGWIQATRSHRQLAKLAREVESWRRRGAPVRMLDRDETARLLGTDVYAGGWLDERNGTIQPFAYARGLALAAARAGAAIHCGTEVRAIVQDGSRWSIATNRGTCRASTVVLATNVRTAQIPGTVERRIGHSYLAAHSVQLATAPLSAAQLRAVLPQRHACGDTSHLRLRYFRLDRDGRFIIGGPGGPTPPHSRAALSFRLLEASARRMFPALRGCAFEFAWAARDSVTPDVMPHLYEPCPRLFCALGYNGRGLALGTALGKLIAELATGTPERQSPFPLTALSKVPFGLRAALKFYLARVVGGR